ncbi:hypothetical protein ASPBRDRAFT_192583 [Aspergillus brasiliensis CBS 101740]|uniref:Uncharacterized protein n=1 Tax=Aspergillus brasiliensis (strain CBS 101740 / IMI 381727 / IBT 21946) TaxID=767769 RepID=A0A1L9UXM5_ASPBC|nr:hypothetical protein ASPBRDRAFT_192583 [Aspergillus brasiliensis CBS 101740]
MAADIVARIPGDETHVEDLPGGGQSNLERFIAYGRETGEKKAPKGCRSRRRKEPESEPERGALLQANFRPASFGPT